MIDWNIVLSVAMGIAVYKIVASFVGAILETIYKNNTGRSEGT